MRRRATLGVIAVAFVITVGSAVGTADGSPAETALKVTAEAIMAPSLADQTLVIAAGGLLLGAGFGVAIASGATYWYKNQQIGGRLQ